MAKFHINAEGVAAACRATIAGNCPFQMDSEHHASKDDARKAHEAVEREAYGPLGPTPLAIKKREDIIGASYGKKTSAVEATVAGETMTPELFSALYRSSEEGQSAMDEAINLGVASNPTLSDPQFEVLAKSGNRAVIFRLCGNPALPQNLQNRIIAGNVYMGSRNAESMTPYMASNPGLTLESMELIMADGSSTNGVTSLLWRPMLGGKELPSKIFDQALEINELKVQTILAFHPQTPPSHLRRLAFSNPTFGVADSIVKNDKTPRVALEQLRDHHSSAKIRVSARRKLEELS